jgi:hypothetical membrane protein
MFIYFPVLICLVGLLLYLFVDPSIRGGKVQEVGRIMFWVGLLAVLLRDGIFPLK